jgi:hypothetical protein
MLKKFPKIFTLIFLSLVILQTGAFVFSALLYTPTRAEAKWTNPTDSLQIKIPGMARFTEPYPCPGDETKTCVPWIGEYIAGIYKYAISIVGILAAVVLMFGGLIWLTAGGSPDKVNNAKAWIGASITGLILALSSYMILYQINPDLVKLNPLKIKLVEKKETVVVGCGWQKVGYVRTVAGTTLEECSKYNLVEANSESKCKEKKPADELTGSSAAGTGVATGYSYTCCCDSEVGASWSFDSGIEKQTGDASDSLNGLLSCMKQKLPAGVGRISSISDSNYIGTPSSCYSSGSICKNLNPPCVHSCTSCHYGRNKSDNKSYAVDFGDEENKTAIITAVTECGGKTLDEGNHVHVSTSDCLNL